MEVRKSGVSRFNPPVKKGSNTPFSAFEQGSVGDVRINQTQMSAIHHLYHSSPSIQAARSILVGQLLSSGLALTRNGKAVKLTPTFEKHLEQCWMPFARSVIDHVLMYGFVVVSIEEEESEPFAEFRKAKRQRSTGGGSSSSSGPASGVAREQNKIGDPQTKTAADAANVVSRAPAPPATPASPAVKNLIPIVPVLGSYEIALTPSGRAGYKRTARVFTTAPARAYTEDPYAATFFRNEPDHNGSIISSVGAAFEFASFVGALRELALSAEVVRATPTLVTQSQPRSNLPGQNGIDQTSLFFDSESRAIQQQSQDAEAGERTAQLALTARLAAELNRLRTTNVDPSTGQAQNQTPNLPPEIPPRLFALPDKQQLVPGALQPQARSDLEGLVRLANDHIAAAMGVPASVVFEGKFSSNSMSQLQLLNTTVSSLAITVNNVLTTTYTAIYGGDGIEGADGEELNLLVSPLTSISELQGLYTSNLVDFETAIPAALHSLGCTAEEISAALERRRVQEKETADMKKIEDKTTKAELQRREKDAKNPPEQQQGGDGASSEKAAKPAASAPAPAPASPSASSKSDE